MTNNITEPLASHLLCPISVDFEPYNISNYPKSAMPTWIATNIISFFVAFPTFYINLLVIWTILEKENLRSTSYNLLLAILALTDLLVGLVVQPLFNAAHLCGLLRCPYACNLVVVYAISVIVCVGWSISTLAIISVERYLSIEYPLYYSTHVTTKKMIVATAVVWVLMPLLLMVSRLQFNDSYKMRQAPLGVSFGLGVVIIFFCLIKVNLTARRQMRAINIQQAAVQPTTQNRIKEYKRTFTLGFLALASVFFYLPTFIIKIIGVTKGKEWNEDFKYISQHIFLTFLHLQSLVNPLILSLRLSYIRAGVKKKLGW